MHNDDISFLSTVLQVYRVKTIIMVPQTQILSQETTCKGLQTMFVKTIQSAFKEIELFRYFSCMVSTKKWYAFIKTFHSMI